MESQHAAMLGCSGSLSRLLLITNPAAGNLQLVWIIWMQSYVGRWSSLYTQPSPSGFIKVCTLMSLVVFSPLVSCPASICSLESCQIHATSSQIQSTCLGLTWSVGQCCLILPGDQATFATFGVPLEVLLCSVLLWWICNSVAKALCLRSVLTPAWVWEGEKAWQMMNIYQTIKLWCLKQQRISLTKCFEGKEHIKQTGRFGSLRTKYNSGQ